MPDDVYTHGHHAAVLRSHSWRTIDNSAAYLSPLLRSGQTVLDVGCGPGTITAEFGERVAPGRVIGIDRSDEVVAMAAAGPHPANVTYRTGDVYALDADDDSVDVVHAHQVLQHLSDPVAALVEMRRVCRPGGVIAVRDSDYGAFTWAPADERLTRWLALYRTVARRNRAEPDAGRHLKAWAIAAGCRDVRASASVWCFASREEQHWWGELWADRMTQSDVATQLLEEELTTRDELDGIADAFRAWAGAGDGWFAVLHGEVLASP